MHQNLHMAPLYLYHIAPGVRDEVYYSTPQGRKDLETGEEWPSSPVCTLRLPSTARNAHCTPCTMHLTPHTGHCTPGTVHHTPGTATLHAATLQLLRAHRHCTHHRLWSHVLTFSPLHTACLKEQNCMTTLSQTFHKVQPLDFTNLDHICFVWNFLFI